MVKKQFPPNKQDHHQHLTYKTTPSLLLFLKQSLKLIFRFKFQFFIIIALSLLATLLITTGMSTTARFKNDFNQYVNSSKRFNESYNYDVGLGTQQSQVLPDFASFMDVAPGYTVAAENNSSYNLIFGNQYQMNPAWTDGQHLPKINNHLPFDIFSTTAAKNIFATIFTNDNNSIAKSLLGTDLKFDSSTHIISGYQPNFSIASLKSFFINQFTVENFNKLPSSALEATLLGNYYLAKNRPANFFVQTINNQPNPVYQYLQYVWASFDQAINKSVNNFFNFYVNTVIKKFDSQTLDKRKKTTNLAAAYAYIQGEVNDLVEKNTGLSNYNGGLTGNNNAPTQLLISNADPTSEISRLTAVVYQYITGTTFSSTGGDYTAFHFVSPQPSTKTETATTNYALNYKSANKNTVLSTDSNAAFVNVHAAFANTGMRGMVNPLYNFDPKADFKLANLKIAGLDFSPLVFKAPFNNFLGGIVDKKNTTATVNEYNFMFHQDMAAVASGFKPIAFRMEAYLYDNIDQKTFRFVVLNNSNNNNYNFYKSNIHIIKGVKPFDDEQILVSPQFARANDLTIGSMIQIKKSTYQISGFATDSYSFIPAAEPRSPIPNGKSSAVIYINHDIYNQINNDTAGSQVAQSEQHAFLTFNDNISPPILGKQATNNQKTLLFSAFLMNKLNGNVEQAVKLIQTGTSSVNNPNIFSSWTFTPFNSSNYRFNWTLLPLATRVLVIVFYVVAGVLFLIALIGCYNVVLKNIKLNATQIAILKAMGVPNFKICFMYTIYSLFIVVLAVPLGYFLGILFQWPLAETFQNFFSLDYLQIFFDWRPFVIAFVVFGAFSFLVCILSSYSVIRKNVVQILFPGASWRNNRLILFIKNRFFKKARFTNQLKLSITANSMGRIGMMSLIFLISTFLVTLSLALPGFLKNVSNSFYEGLKYRNSFDYIASTPNAPLSNNGVQYAPPPQALEQKYKPKTNFNFSGLSSNFGPGYLDPATYVSSSSKISPMPLFVYKGDDLTPTWFSTSLIQKDNASGIFAEFAQIMGNNLYAATGHAFTAGEVVNLVDMMYHNELYYKQSGVNQQSRQDLLTNLNLLFQTGLAPILADALSIKIPADLNNLPWPKQISELLNLYLPVYLKQYVNRSASRQTQFDFGWNFSLNVINQDVQTTTANTVFGNNQLSLIGINPVSPIINLTPSQKKLLSIDLTRSLQAKLNAVANYYSYPTPDLRPQTLKKPQAITLANGYQLYNPDTNTLTLPTILNQQAASQLEYRQPRVDDNNMRPIVPSLQYLDSNQNWINLPKAFWVYNDNGYVKAAQNLPNWKNYRNATYIQSDRTEQNPGYYINPFNLVNSDFTLYNEPENKPNNKPTEEVHAGFVSNYLDQNNQVQPWLRPKYYSNNIELYLPLFGKDAIDKSLYLDPQQEHSSRLSEIVKQVTPGQVPQSVKNAYYGQETGNWLLIRPYNLAYDSRFDPQGSSVSNFLAGYLAWMQGAINNPYHKILRFTSSNTSSTTFTTLPGLKINYDFVGTNNTYGNATAYTNDALINFISGYSTHQNYGYQLNNTLFDPQTGAKSDYVPNNNIAKILINSSHQNGFIYNIKNAPQMWSNSNYSLANEPYNLTTMYAASNSIRFGFRTTIGVIGHDNPLITNQNLLSAKTAFINNLTAIMLSIASVILAIVIFCTTLLILLVSNLFLQEYERFMVLMKTEGYRRGEVMWNTINIFTPWIILAVGAGVFLGWLALFLANKFSYNVLHFALPFLVAWWVYPIAILLVCLMYFATFIMFNHRLKRNTSELLRSSEQVMI